MQEFKGLLKLESTYQLSDELFDILINSMEELDLNTYDVLVRNGSVDANIYFVKEGILREYYFNAGEEVTRGFALPGTMMISWHSYYYRKPAFFQVGACCKSKVLKLSKRQFDKMIADHHEFSKWLISMLQCQLYYYEMKQAVIKGDAKSRFISLVMNRKEIIQKVPLKLIASYLGITQAYLSRLRKQVATGKIHF